MAGNNRDNDCSKYVISILLIRGLYDIRVFRILYVMQPKNIMCAKGLLPHAYFILQFLFIFENQFRHRLRDRSFVNQSV